MRNYLILLLIISVLSCKSKKNAIESPLPKTDAALKTVTISDVEIIKINRAETIGNRLLEACNTSRLKPFTNDEATQKVIQNATISKISATCKKINFRNGKFLGLKLINITKNDFDDSYIFRYLIEYEKNHFKRELKVTVNAVNKVSAISTKELSAKPF